MNFTILIGTCDKYSFLWNDFVTLFNRYWDDRINVKKYFLSETIKREFEGFDFLTPGNVAYSDCIRHALDQIDTEYVLWMQDDYFLQKTITKEQFENYFKLITDSQIDRFCINRPSTAVNSMTFYKTDDGYDRLIQNSYYTISMQISLWNKDFFKKCLPHSITETPWEFEINGSQRLNNSIKHNIIYELTDDYWYYEAMRKGKFTDHYERIKIKENL